MSKIYNWGYIGLGWIAEHTISAFSHAENARVYAAASKTPGNAKDFAKRHGIPKAYTSYEDIVNDPDVDIIYICTPVCSHREAAELCMSHGKHVICEKPLAMTEADARAILAAQEKYGVFCMEAMWTRFIPAIRKLEDMLKAEVLGEIRLVQADYAIYWPYDPDYHLYRLDMGGSTMLDQGIYPLTFACLAYQGYPTRSTGLANLRGGVDMRSGSILGFENGGIAAITTGADIQSGWDAVIYGEKGSIRVPEFYHPQVLEIKYHNAEETEKIEIPYEDSGYQFEMMEVMQCIEQGRMQSNIMPLETSIRLTQVMDGLRRQWGVIYPSEEAVQ